MIIDFVANHVFGFDWGNNNEKIGKKFGFISQGLFSFPINIPGTNYHKCMKYKEEVMTMIRAAVKERLISLESHRDDFLDHALRFLHNEDFLTEEFIIQIMFGRRVPPLRRPKNSRIPRAAPPPISNSLIFSSDFEALLYLAYSLSLSLLLGVFCPFLCPL